MSGRQALRLPTSMNSMKRTITRRAAEMFDQIEHGVIVHAAFDHRVDLDRARGPRRCAASMPCKT